MMKKMVVKNLVGLSLEETLRSVAGTADLCIKYLAVALSKERKSTKMTHPNIHLCTFGQLQCEPLMTSSKLSQ